MSEERTYDIEAEKINKSFGEQHVLRDLELQVKKGETFVLVGGSGCGKSVFLKHIVGLLEPDSGSMTVLGRTLQQLDRDTLMDVRMRVGMVFQSSALFNSMTVRENVSLGLRENTDKSDDEIEEIVQKMLGLVDMTGTEDKLPEELSGGMRKRVAVARTLAMQPDIILFDEPTVGLDPIMSQNVDDLITDLKKQVHCTNVVVTHDMFTAFGVGDRVGMLHEGQIVEVAPPEEFRNSDSKVVQEFIARNICWRDQ